MNGRLEKRTFRESEDLRIVARKVRCAHAYATVELRVEATRQRKKLSEVLYFLY
jgi:hypothetical protein